MAEDDGETGGENGKRPIRASEIESAKDLERWLTGRPREEAVIIAARAALRVAPLLGRLPRKGAEKDHAAVILRSFRAIAATWLVGTSPSARTKRAAVMRPPAEIYSNLPEASFTASAALAVITATDAALAAALAVARACRASYVAAVGAIVAEDPPSVLVAEIGDAAAASAILASAADVLDLDDGKDVEALGRAPLWPGATPDWAEARWQALKTHLLEQAPADEQWWVWTEWYEDRLKGAKSAENPDGVELIPELERDRVLKVSEEDWKKGPVAANGRIAELIRDYRGRKWSSRTGTVADLEPPKSNETLDDALKSPALRAAYADFKVDPDSGATQMVPFEADRPALPPPAAANWRDLLGALAAGARARVADLRLLDRAGASRPGPNLPETFRLNVHRLGREAGKPQESVNGRVIVLKGDAMLGDLADEGIAGALPDDMLRRFEDLASLYRDFRGRYLAEERAALESVPPLTDDVPAEEVVETLERVERVLVEAEWEEIPAPPGELAELVHENLAALRASRMREDLMAAGAARDALERSRRRMEVSTFATVSRFALIAGASTFAYGVGYAALGTGASILSVPLTVAIAAFPDEAKSIIRRILRFLELVRDE